MPYQTTSYTEDVSAKYVYVNILDYRVPFNAGAKLKILTSLFQLRNKAFLSYFFKSMTVWMVLSRT